MRQMLLGAVSAMSLLCAGAVRAEAPKVAVDISPVHSLVARVMGDLGFPELVMSPGASPHGYAMRPSEARALSKADLVIWVGPSLTPWLDRSIDSVAAQADQLVLSGVDGIVALPFREDARFEAHDHDHDEHGHEDHDEHDHEEHAHEDHDAHDHEEHAHEDHDEHDHDEHDHDAHDHDEHGHEDHEEHEHEAHAHEDHDEHDHEAHAHEDHDAHEHDAHDHDEHGHEDHAEHEHEAHAHEDHDEHEHDSHDHDEHGHDDHDEHEHAGGIDPHYWLDPVNAIVWLEAIAEALSAADPEHAAQYHANAEAGAAEIEAVMAQTLAQLASLRHEPFIVFHDAYQYFENRFGVAAAGAISLGDAAEPGPARLAEIRETVTELGVSCIFAEPQFNPRLVRVVAEGSGARSAVLDPQGLEIEPGAGLYPELIRRIGRSMETCLSEG